MGRRKLIQITILVLNKTDYLLVFNLQWIDTFPSQYMEYNFSGMIPETLSSLAKW
jgi:hypothetical protein